MLNQIILFYLIIKLTAYIGSKMPIEGRLIVFNGGPAKLPDEVLFLNISYQN